MKVYILYLWGEEWYPKSIHMTLGGATRAKYRHLNESPTDLVYVEEREVEE